MKVAIVGGTGSLGRGLALRLSKKQQVLVGSRDQARGREAAEELSRRSGLKFEGGLNEEVAKMSDAAVLAISYTEGLEAVAGLEEALAGKLVISPIVPLKVQGGIFSYSKADGSAAEQVAFLLNRSRVAASLHTIPAASLLNADAPLDLDALVVADSKDVFAEAAEIVGSIEGLRPLYAGPLSQARTIEGLTPLLLNLAKLNGLKNPSIRFV